MILLMSSDPEGLKTTFVRQLLENEITTRKQSNLAKYESFEEELQGTINDYNEGFLSTQQVIDELRNYAERIQETDDRQDELGLSDEELAFYDAISANTDTEIDDETLRLDQENRYTRAAETLIDNLEDKFGDNTGELNDFLNS